MHTLQDSCSLLLSSCSISGSAGDFYDLATPHNNELMIGMGNISLEGTAGPILMRGLHATLRSLLTRGLTAASIAGELNRMLWNIAPDHTFSALFTAHIDPLSGRIHYLNAGHEAALILRHEVAGRERTMVRLEPHAPILGLSRRSEYRERSVRFEAGDTLVVVSEGAGEAAERILRHGDPECLRDLALRIVDQGNPSQDRTAVVVHHRDAAAHLVSCGAPLAVRSMFAAA